MNYEMIELKEEAIHLAVDKVEDASAALAEFFPEAAEELEWFLEEMGKCLTRLHAERLALPDSDLYGGGRV